LPRFIKEGIWENNYDDKYIEKVKNVPVGSLLAAKTSFTRKHNGKNISVLKVHCIGEVVDNPKDGQILKVNWDKNFSVFKIDGRGAYRRTISRVNYQENIDLIFGNDPGLRADEEKAEDKAAYPDFPLNQILFGSPGTGKTFHTVNKAISIVDRQKEESLGDQYDSRKDLTDRFDEVLIRDWENPYGQVAFITFHQNMGYEDFIEGIKPGLTEDNQVSYDIEPGIFRKIAEIARDNWLDANKGDSANVSFEEAFQKLKEEWYENPDIKFPLRTEGKEFTIIGFTKTSIKFKKASGGTNHTLSISTLRDYYYNRRDIHQSGLGIYYPGILQKLKSYQPGAVSEKEEKNYVLIIDEINRGNVSQIFGELITLIEKGKRLGEEEGLEVVLPYSKERFGVPPNLYIIGTMNTADRSVEALDTALRRRFDFSEMPPQAQLLNPRQILVRLWEKHQELDWDDSVWTEVEEKFLDLHGAEIIDRNAYEELESEEDYSNLPKQFERVIKFGDFSLELLLTTINNRIERLLDRDHLIGHSYFMSVIGWEDLQSSFYNNLIPLLQEYFFGDYAKIGAVLGVGFVFIQEELHQTEFATGYQDIDYAEHEIYQIIDYRPNRPGSIYIQQDMDFKKAIDLLFNRHNDY
jgi:5-methylcytosine-specific restriction protein B